MQGLAPTPRTVNNHVYADLGERWYTASNDPVALLRAESRSRLTFLKGELEARFCGRPCRVLDVGCGAGFHANPLSAAGHDVVGLDTSAEALAVAARHDLTQRAHWRTGDAGDLPFSDASFDAVLAMDLLEHVEDPGRVIAEAGRVLRPGGLFVFHTFNRTWLAWLVVIKGVEWFVEQTPKDLHVLRLFIRPEEARAMCTLAGLCVDAIRGFGPRPFTRAFARMLFTGTVPDDFAFRFGGSTTMGYTGTATREA